MFTDREDAAEQLVEVMKGEFSLDPDLVVAVPRGGMPLGRVVADAFGVPLDIVTGKKMTAPGHSDLSIGAVSVDGVCWRNESLIRDMGVSEDYLRQERLSARSQAQAKEESYREIKDGEPVEDQHVIVVDDGVATGATMHACVMDLVEKGAAQVTVGVPVGDPRGLDPITERVQHVFAVLTPGDFEAVSHYYDDFHQLDDQEAMSYLLF